MRLPGEVPVDTFAVGSWLEEYKHANVGLLQADPQFRQWLDEEYVPLQGAWQY